MSRIAPGGNVRRPVRVGIVILPELRWAQAQARWRRAEEYGFAHAWTYDHLAWRDLADGPWFDAMVTLTAAALATSRLRLGTLVASANFRHPVHFAREITALDDVSGGRFPLGVGAGAAGPRLDVVWGGRSPRGVGGGAAAPLLEALGRGREPLAPRDRADRFEEFVSLL